MSTVNYILHHITTCYKYDKTVMVSDGRLLHWAKRSHIMPGPKVSMGAEQDSVEDKQGH